MLVVQSANWSFVRRFHSLAQVIPVGVIGRPCPDELVDFAEWVDQVNPEYLGADPEFLRCVHELGMSSLVWTVDEAAGMERAIDAGADGIIKIGRASCRERGEVAGRDASEEQKDGA